MATNPLRELNACGQSVWYDYIRRGEILSGRLQMLIDEDGLSGVTSNPSIFEKAIAGSKDYNDAIEKLAREGKDSKQIFEALAVEDIRNACDLFRPTYDATRGKDGFVSIEVAPDLAHDTAGTVAQARHLFAAVGRPNVLVKVPATAEGIPAIEQLLGEGININITLLFAIERYEQVANAYVAALEKLAREARPLERVASVASFFVSRIDTLADQQLDAKLEGAKTPREKEKISNLFGKVAVANAKLAYRKFQDLFASARFKALEQQGARVQRMLWASTSTKNPKYRDVLYVEELIGPNTINTMPSSTMDAFRHHGEVRPTIEEGIDDARRVMGQLGEVGVDLRAITQALEDQGVASFAKDFEKLLAVIEEKRRQVVAAAPSPSLVPTAGGLHLDVRAALERLDQEKFPERLWERDPSLWKQEPAAQRVIRNALGWLRISHAMLGHLEALAKFVAEVRGARFTHAVLLGMGGSSLAPDVCRATFGAAPGYLELHVLDSTVPAAVAQVEKSIDVGRSLFLVSSKSGGTTETLSFFRYFYDRVRALKGERAGENFVAITDPGTSLEKLAGEKRFRQIFAGCVDIGGRYSALSNFGMVPAALAGVDVEKLLERAERMVHASSACVPAQDNPGATLGATLAEAARKGRDKITFVISPGIATFADWVEQLIAESTGKEGKGLLPVAGEALGAPAAYGNDRLFVRIALDGESDDAAERGLKALESAGHPVVRIALRDKLDLGQEFFRWEIATATAGRFLGINPFDQPNVQESKDHTHRLLEEFRRQGKLAEEPAALVHGNLRVHMASAPLARLRKQAGAEAGPVEGLLAEFLRQGRPGDYVALMAYLPPAEAHTARLQSLRTQLRDATRLATTFGYGPRFLHSTGQLHKGGPNTGLFIQITADDAMDLPIPGEAYSFSTLKQAQALGDLGSLASKDRRVMRFHLAKDVKGGLDELGQLVQSALQGTAQAQGR